MRQIMSHFGQSEILTAKSRRLTPPTVQAVVQSTPGYGRREAPDRHASPGRQHRCCAGCCRIGLRLFFAGRSRSSFPRRLPIGDGRERHPPISGSPAGMRQIMSHFGQSEILTAKSRRLTPPTVQAVVQSTPGYGRREAPDRHASPGRLAHPPPVPRSVNCPGRSPKFSIISIASSTRSVPKL